MNLDGIVQQPTLLFLFDADLTGSRHEQDTRVALTTDRHPEGCRIRSKSSSLLAKRGSVRY